MRLGFVKVYGKKIKVKEYNGLLGLNLSQRKLGNLNQIIGFEELKNLQFLDLSHNFISEIKQLADFSKIQWLNLSYNKITSMEGLKCLKKIQVLDLSGNKIDVICGLEALINLQKLDLSYNAIRKVEGLEQLKNIQSLSLGGNPIGTEEQRYLEIGAQELIQFIRDKRQKKEETKDRAELRRIKRLEKRKKKHGYEMVSFPFDSLILLEEFDLIGGRTRQEFAELVARSQKMQEERRKFRQIILIKRKLEEIQRTITHRNSITIEELENVKQNLQIELEKTIKIAEAAVSTAKIRDSDKSTGFARKLVKVAQEYKEEIQDIETKIKNKLDEVKNQTGPRVILKLAKKYPQLNLVDLAAEMAIDERTTLEIVTKMFQDGHIKGRYFENSKTIYFKRVTPEVEAEIDALLAKYKEWEEGQVGKK